MVWEAAHGPIPPHGEIHHVNEIPTDNRLENLTLCRSSSEHTRRYHLESRQAIGRRVGESNRGKPKPASQRAAIGAANRKAKALPPEIERAILHLHAQGHTLNEIAEGVFGSRRSRNRVWRFLNHQRTRLVT